MVGTLYKNFVAAGIAGFWNDVDEQAIFKFPPRACRIASGTA